MILSFHPCFEADFNIILGSRCLDTHDLDLIKRADAVILAQGCPLDVYEACLRCGVRSFPNYNVRFRYPGKTGQIVLFENFGFLYPETLCWPTVKKFKEGYSDPDVFPHQLPFLVKDDQSHEAEGVFFVERREALSEALDYLERREKSGLSGFVTQAYIPSDGNVLRVVIIGKRIISYWKRPRESGQVITTISRGAVIDHQWKLDLQEKGGAKAHVLAEKTGINLAAVDFVFPLSEKDPEPFFLEINYYFGRRGLGGSKKYYKLLYQAVRDWLVEEDLDPEMVKLV